MGNGQCFKTRDDNRPESRSMTKENKIQQSTSKPSRAQQQAGITKNPNPFKKKRGEGYVPPSQQPDQPIASLASYSLLNQKPDEETKPVNDAIVAGTFGGAGGVLPHQAPPPKDFEAQRQSISNQQNSFYSKSPTQANLAAADPTGMMSFNPNPMPVAPPKPPTQSGEMPPMSFGGNMLE